MTTNLRSYFKNQIGSMVSFLTELIRLELPTLDKAAVDALGQRVQQEIRDLGGDVIVHACADVGDIVEARWHADQPGQPLLCLCHMDTVHAIGEIERNPVRLEDKKLYGPGAVDMKASIAICLATIRGLQQQNMLPERPVSMLFTTDEETSSSASRALIEKRGQESQLALVFEPAMPDGSLKTWRKAVGDFNVRVTGKSAHAGADPQSGVNAIEEAAHQIIKLQELTDYKVGTTVSVGIINGGTRRNVVPEFCDIAIDTRAMTAEEVDRLTAEIFALKPVLLGAELEIFGSFDRPPMERNTLMIDTFNQAKEIGARYDLTLRDLGTGGGSDGNFTAALGIPTLDGLGPIGRGAHTSDEYVVVDTMARSAALLAALILDWPRM